MNKSDNYSVLSEEGKSFFDLKQFIQLLYLKWYWIIISMVVFGIIALIYLWVTPQTYTIGNKMIIMDSKGQNTGVNAKAAMLNSLPLGIGSSLGGSFGIDTEKEILNSSSLIRDVVNELKLHTEYRFNSWGRSILLYKNQPLDVSLDPAHLQWFDKELLTTYHQIDLTIKKKSDSYSVYITLKENDNETELAPQLITTLPAVIKTEVGSLTISDNLLLSSKERKNYSGDYSLDVNIIPPMTCANLISSRLNFESSSKNKKKVVSNMLNISIIDENHIRGIDFINALVEQYNKRANDEKNEEVMRNEEFVNNRMAKLDKELGSSDAAWENSKKSFQITSPEVDAADVMQKKSVYETQLVAIGTELQLHDFLSEYVNDPANLYEIIPSAAVSTGTSDGVGTSGTVSLLSQHNLLVNQRRDLLKSVSEKSPQIQRLDQTIQELQPVILTALKRDRQQILMRQSTLQREYGKYLGRVGTAPQMERVLTEIGRQREIKQGVYLLMLQKREEAALELIKSAMKGKLIDETQVIGPSQPDKKLVLFEALFLGLLLSIGVLYLIEMLKTKFELRADLESASRFPVIGEIPLQGSSDSIRDLRTNLFLKLREGQKTILIASNEDGEGKTYIAQNLADCFNAIGKKTFLIDGDLRKSNKGGHPADILAGESFATEVSKAKEEYDYVILDSPAMSQCSDAYQLASFADVTLFVVKSGSTNKSVIESLNGDDKLPHIMLALNAIDTTTKKYKLNKK